MDCMASFFPTATLLVPTFRESPGTRLVGSTGSGPQAAVDG